MTGPGVNEARGPSRYKSECRIYNPQCLLPFIECPVDDQNCTIRCVHLSSTVSLVYDWPMLNSHSRAMNKLFGRCRCWNLILIGRMIWLEPDLLFRLFSFYIIFILIYSSMTFRLRRLALVWLKCLYTRCTLVKSTLYSLYQMHRNYLS